MVLCWYKGQANQTQVFPCSLSETNFGPESSTLADPFGPSTFGSTDSGAQSATAAHSNGFGSHTFSPGPPSSTQVCVHDASSRGKTASALGPASYQHSPGMLLEAQ